MHKKVAWFSAGVSSFVACYLERKNIDEIFYIDIDDQHPDSMRFVKDCEKALGKEIKILKSPYGSVENCILAANGFKNARTGFYFCTGWLKKRVRQTWEHSQIGNRLTYVWGFDVDEKHRAERLDSALQNINHENPLIREQLKKEDCHAMAYKLGIQRPAMYDLGYSNNNCIGCVKGGMGYWNKCRNDFPEQFEKRCRLERKIGRHFLKEEGLFLDTLDPNRGDMQKEILQDCGIFCELALKET